MKLDELQSRINSTSNWDFSDLNALFLNCTLKQSPQKSHTELLVDMSKAIMEANKVSVELMRPVDFEIPPGIFPVMTEHGYEKDNWPEIHEKILKADILVIASPIWLGQVSSICTKVIERLYAYSSMQNDKGQYVFYDRVGGCLITGNEDGVKHCCRNVLYSLQHVGYLIPPQAESGWIGEYGPGKSYGDEGNDTPIGYDNMYTQRNTTIMTWNLMHMAYMLKQNGGIPAHGNLPSEWE